MNLLNLYASAVTSRYKLLVAIVIASTLAFAYAASGLAINATPYFLELNHPSRLADKYLKETFTGSGENLMIATVTDKETIFNPQTLSDLHRFTLGLENLSLTDRSDVKRIQGYIDELRRVTELPGSVSQLSAQLQNYLTYATSTPFGPGDRYALKELEQLMAKQALLTPADFAYFDELHYRVTPIKKVRSIVRIESITANGDELDIHPMMYQVPQTADQIKALEQEARANPLLRNILFSENPKVINTLVELTIPQDDAPNMRRVYDATIALTEQLKLSDSYHLGGPPAIFAQTSATMEKDSNMFFPVVFVVVMVLLFAIFRNVRSMLLPVGVAVISVVWTMGTMSLLGVKQNIVTTMLPVFLIAIGVADSIHYLAEYRTRLRDGVEKPALEVARSLFKPMLMTSVTTMAGFLSLTYTPIRFIQEFGIFVAIGVGYAFIITMLLLPSIQLWLKPQSVSKHADSPWLQRCADWNLNLIIRHYRWLWSIALVAVVLVGTGLTKLEIDNEMIGYFSPETRVYQDNEVFRKELAGSGVIEFILSSDQPGYFKQTDAMEGLARVVEKLKTYPYVGDVYDLPAFMKLMNKALHGDDPAAYQLPEAAENIYAQYLFLYENSDGNEIFNVVDESASEARLIVFVRSDKTSVMDTIASGITPYIHTELEHIRVTPAGFGAVLIATRDEIIYNQINSLVLSFGFVLILLLCLFRSLSHALIGIVPLVLTVIVNFALMGWTNLYLDVGTAIVAPIAIGIGVDYAIYFINSCRKHAVIDKEAIHATLKHLYPPIVFNTLVQGCGFLVLTFSSHQALVNLGLLVTLTMLITAIVTLLVLPSLMLMFGNGSKAVLETRELPAT